MTKSESHRKFQDVYNALKASFRISADDLVSVLGVKSKDNIYAYKRGSGTLSPEQWKKLINTYPSVLRLFEETPDGLKESDILFEILKAQKATLKETKKSNEILDSLLQEIRAKNPKI